MGLLQDHTGNLRRLIIVLALLVVIPAAFLTWGEICTLPNEIWIHDEFAMSIRQNKHSAAKLSWLIFDEVSEQLALRGTSGIVILDFFERCEVDHCIVDSMYMVVQLEHRAACSWSDARFNHTFVSIDIADVESENAEISLEAIRQGMTDYHPLPNRFIEEIERVREQALQSVTRTEWLSHPELRFSYWWWWNGFWDINVRTATGKPLHSLKIDHPKAGQLGK